MENQVNKYPRTYHLTTSEGCTSDDKKLDNDDFFLNKEIVITAKLDGSNFCMTKESCFARSHSGPPTHKSFNWAKSFHNSIKHNIPENIIIYSEYCFAKHSIHYSNLPHYLSIFNILKDGMFLSWKEVEDYSYKLETPTVPVLFKGKISSHLELKNICSSLMKDKEFKVDEREGIVIRVAENFKEKDFDFSCAKIVRKNHVQTDSHWRSQEIIRNKLAI